MDKDNKRTQPVPVAAFASPMAAAAALISTSSVDGAGAEARLRAIHVKEAAENVYRIYNTDIVQAAKQKGRDAGVADLRKNPTLLHQYYDEAVNAELAKTRVKLEEIINNDAARAIFYKSSTLTDTLYIAFSALPVATLGKEVDNVMAHITKISALFWEMAQAKEKRFIHVFGASPTVKQLYADFVSEYCKTLNIELTSIQSIIANVRDLPTELRIFSEVINALTSKSSALESHHFNAELQKAVDRQRQHYGELSLCVTQQIVRSCTLGQRTFVDSVRSAQYEISAAAAEAASASATATHPPLPPAAAPLSSTPNRRSALLDSVRPDEMAALQAACAAARLATNKVPD